MFKGNSCIQEINLKQMEELLLKLPHDKATAWDLQSGKLI
jgi:hypothetical protein